MHRIAGVNLPDEKRVEVGLTYIFGVGKSTSLKILEKLNIDKNRKIKDLTEVEVQKIREILEKQRVEGDLKREISDNIKRLKDIASYRGDRHRKGLPLRGQRTKTNARTKRGRKVSAGSGRKPAAQKT